MKKFDAIIELERAVQLERAATIFGSTYAIRIAAARREKAAKDALYAAVDKLTPSEARKFGKYRLKDLDKKS